MQKITFGLLGLLIVLVTACAPTVSSAPASNLPSGAKIVAQGPNEVVNVVLGKYYHYNASCGCPAGVEDNYVFRATKSASFQISGTVWEYDRLPNYNEVWRAEDRYPGNLPWTTDALQFVSINELPR